MRLNHSIIPFKFMAIVGRLVSARRQSQTVPLDRDGKAIKMAAKHLAANSGRIDRSELFRRYNWLRSKYQAYYFRRTGGLYRFNDRNAGPFDGVSNVELGYIIGDASNRLLINLYSLNQEISHESAIS